MAGLSRFLRTSRKERGGPQRLCRVLRVRPVSGFGRSRFGPRTHRRGRRPVPIILPEVANARGSRRSARGGGDPRRGDTRFLRAVGAPYDLHVTAAAAGGQTRGPHRSATRCGRDPEEPGPHVHIDVRGRSAHAPGRHGRNDHRAERTAGRFGYREGPRGPDRREVRGRLCAARPPWVARTHLSVCASDSCGTDVGRRRRRGSGAVREHSGDGRSAPARSHVLRLARPTPPLGAPGALRAGGIAPPGVVAWKPRPVRLGR